MTTIRFSASSPITFSSSQHAQFGNKGLSQALREAQQRLTSGLTPPSYLKLKKFHFNSAPLKGLSLLERWKVNVQYFATSTVPDFLKNLGR
jgi:hypothetical protein